MSAAKILAYRAPWEGRQKQQLPRDSARGRKDLQSAAIPSPKKPWAKGSSYGRVGGWESSGELCSHCNPRGLRGIGHSSGGRLGTFFPACPKHFWELYTYSDGRGGTTAFRVCMPGVEPGPHSPAHSCAQVHSATLNTSSTGWRTDRIE